MKKSITSVLTLGAILASGVAYAITMADPDIPALELTASTPAEGATLPGLFAGDVISITPADFSEVPDMYIIYDIEGKENNEWEIMKASSWLNRDDEKGCYTAEIYGNYEMYEGTEYRMVFTAYEDDLAYYYGDYPIAQAIVNLKGSTEPFLYSPVTLESYSPEDSDDDPFAEVGTLPNDCPYISMTFSGDVTITEAGYLLGSGGGIISFGPVEAVGEPTTVDGKEYAKEWHLTFREGFLESRSDPLIISVFAKDAEGRVVKGNAGEKDLSCFQLYYNVEGMYRTLTYEFGEEPLTAVRKVTATYPGFALNESYLTSSPIVTKDGVKVASVVKCDSLFPPGTDPEEPGVSSIGVLMTFDTLLTTPGTYTLEMPAGYLNIGEEFMGFYQAAENVEFEIAESMYAEITPAPGVVTELSYFDLVYDLDGELAINPEGERPYIYIASENMGSSKWASLSLTYQYLTLKLTGAITDADEYTLVIPTGYLTIDGEPVPGFNATYTIKGTSEDPSEYPAVFTPAAGKVDALPAAIDIVFPDYAEASLGQGKAYLTAFGSDIPLDDAELGEEFNELIQALPEYYQGLDIEGEYIITFPAGYFNLGGNGDPSPLMTVKYTIGEGGGEEYAAEFDPAPESTLLSLPSRIEFNFPDYESINSGGGTATIQFNDEDPVDLPEWWYEPIYELNAGYQELGEYAGSKTDGTYTVRFPAGYFELENRGKTELSEEMTVVYYVDRSTIISDPAIVFTPAAGAVKELPDQVIFRFDDYSWLVNYEGPVATIRFNNEEPVELPLADINYDNPDDWNEGVQPLGEFAGKNADGTYTITFPEGYFFLADEENWDLFNSEITLVYTIGGETPELEPVKFDPADNSELEALPAFITLTFPSEWIQGETEEDATIQFNDNEPVALPEFEKDYDLPALLYQQSLGEFAGATAGGTYVIRFPENFFRIGSWNNAAAAVPVEAMSVTYTINDAGVTLVGIEADRYHVYDLNGVKVLDTTNADDLKALHGLYIVNGVKIMLK